MLTLILVERQTDRQGERGKHSVSMARCLTEPFLLKCLADFLIYMPKSDRSLREKKSFPSSCVSLKFLDIQMSPVVRQAAKG